MRLLTPAAPPYDPRRWVTLPLEERGRLACEGWALQGYGTPLGAYAFYLLKIGLYIGGWLFFCRGAPGLLAPIAFQKAILWSMLFEGLGLGAGSGPLTGRYLPPLGGFLHFLRPGTTKLPAIPGLPILGGTRRTWLDVALYAAFVAAVLRALASRELDA